MLRAGSVLGVSICFEVTAQTTAGDIIVNVNWWDPSSGDAIVLTKTISIDGTGTYRGSITQARDTDSFDADDIIGVFFQYDDFVGTISHIHCLVEIQVDT